MLVTVAPGFARAGVAVSPPPPPPPPAASALSITTQPAGAVDDLAFTTQPVVRILDQYGQNFSQSGTTITAAKASGSGTLAGTTTASTNGSGIATFTNLEIQGTGSHTLSFSASGLTGATSNSFTVEAASGFTPYANKPAWATTLVKDYGFPDSIPASNDTSIGSSGLSIAWNAEGNCTRQEDATGPESPNYVAQWLYPNGMTPGNGSGLIGQSMTSTSRVYVGFWVKWDEDFQFHPVSTKLFYLESGNIILEQMWGDELVIHHPSIEFPEGLRVPTPADGNWHHFEYSVDHTDDEIKLWIDGVLEIDWSVSLSGSHNEYNFNSTWGGAGGTKVGNSYRWIDHFQLWRA